ncbi:histidinol dehydrogenase [Synergistaceae bacterium OttesenSCG-928-D05]|nr:histidinol dehydrogenase [Synergistaceae bacterium OttesenSCG-928-D05]
MKILKRSKERTVATTKELRQGVADIIEDVRANGNAALFRYNEQFDACTRKNLRVSQDEIKEAYSQLTKQEIADIEQAAANIRDFARAQRETMRDLPAYTPKPGVTLGHKNIPVRACCCYVPGGGYPLYSSALMLAIPAKTAGVPRVAACSPTMRGTNKIHPKTLVAMDIAGADEIYAVGGAHAIAAFSYGTEQIAPVDLIVGPGNSYVTEAKRQCYGQVGIDFVAGPSEVLVIADETAEAGIIAADLLAQSEHDRVAKGIVVTTSEALAQAVIAEIEKQLATLETAELARASWNDYGEVILVDSLDEAVQIANEMAPEHLEIQTADSDAITAGLYNYGSLFVGKYTAEVFGDYASGTNHTLPTLRAARYTGGVWVGTFLKTCTHQTFTKEATLEIAPLVARLARGEGLEGHARAAEARLKEE